MSVEASILGVVELDGAFQGGELPVRVAGRGWENEKGESSLGV